jgi:hypothetical protein
MPRPKSDTIESMGLENFINAKFAYLTEKFGMKPYQKVEAMFTAGHPDDDIAKEFSTPERTINYQTVGNWRRWFIGKRKEK